MVFLITPANRSQHASELTEIFRLRHTVLIEQLGWRGLRSVNGCEIDEFDNEHAIYMGQRAESGELTGCVRLNPTNTPTLTAEKFSRLVQFADLPARADCYDVTRHLVSRKYQRSLRESLGGLDLFCAFVEFGLAQKAAAFTAVIPVPFYLDLNRIGISMQALGFPEQIEGEECLVAQGAVTLQSLQALYRATHNSQPRLEASLLPAGRDRAA